MAKLRSRDDMDMTMTTDGPSDFLRANRAIARDYWYGVAACAAFFAVLRIVTLCRITYITRWKRISTYYTPSRPVNIVSRLFATVTALTREVLYPQPLWFIGKFWQHLTPPPLGRCLFIITYWALILNALWKDSILTPDSPLYAYYWEKVAYRAAWVSVTQLPIIYCLSCKHNIISWITGISYERLNWLHRWSAITLFFTVIVHWSWFFQEWTLGGIVKMEFDMMPMVRYGFGAWAVLGWMVLTSFGYFRQLAYEFFVLQHILAAFIFLWLVHTHIPSYASHNVWLAVGFVALDWVFRLLNFAWRNLISRHFGYRATIEQLPGKAVELLIKDVKFRWRSGQHIYLYIPSIRPLENHPFTIANSCGTREGRCSSDMRLVIRAYSGFSRSLATKVNPYDSGPPRELRAFVFGPFGNPPPLKYYDAITLIASGAGATFITPILQDLVADPGPVRRIDFHWIVRSSDETGWFQRQLLSLLHEQSDTRFHLTVQVFVTHPSLNDKLPDQFRSSTSDSCNSGMEVTDIEARSSSSSIWPATPTYEINRENEKQNLVAEAMSTSKRKQLATIYGRRPNPAEMILPALESARGETAVVVCGSSSLVAQVRNYVSYISDDRAVHKGSGAQGIFLFSEKFDW